MIDSHHSWISSRDPASLAADNAVRCPVDRIQTHRGADLGDVRPWTRAVDRIFLLAGEYDVGVRW
jgi:hypothetical protein